MAERPDRGRRHEAEQDEPERDEPERPTTRPLDSPAALAQHDRRLDQGRVFVRLGAERDEARLELLREVVHRDKPVAGIFLQRAVDGGRDADVHIGTKVEHARRRLVHVLHRDGDEAVAGERHASGQKFEEDDPQRVDVGRRLDVAPPRLLGRDVARRPEDGSGLRHALDLERAGDPEVGHLGLPVPVQDHVLRLDVAVDEPVVVREREAAGDLDRELERAANRHRPALVETLLQRLAVDELEDDELPPVLLAAVDDRDDVRVRELCDGARLAAEALHILVVSRVVLMQDLQRDVPLEQGVVRLVDAGHAARADELLDLVPTTDQLADHGRETFPKLPLVTPGLARSPLPTRRALPRARRR